MEFDLSVLWHSCSLQVPHKFYLKPVLETKLPSENGFDWDIKVFLFNILRLAVFIDC